MSPTDEPRDTDLQARLTALEHTVSSLNNQLTLLDQWRQQVQIAEARTDEKWKNVDKRFDDLDKKVDKVSGLISKLLWTIATTFFVGLMGAFLTFLINGGLKVP